MARGEGRISDNELHSSLTNELDSKALQSSLDNLAGTGRTTETVKGNADAIDGVSDALASHQADYVSQIGYGATTGSAKRRGGVTLQAWSVSKHSLRSCLEFLYLIIINKQIPK